MKDLAGRVAVVTGAASGIGRGLVERCAANGMRVVAADVEEGALADTEWACRDAGGEAVAVVTDVSDSASVEALAERAWEAFGQADLVCANAGVWQGGIMWERSVEDWEWVLGVNLWGVVHTVRSFVPRMLEQGIDGHVVVTSSMAGLLCSPFSGPYQTSKFAAFGLAESLAHDLAATGAPIGVSVLCPGAVRTQIGTSDRNRPDELGHPQAEDTAFVDDALREITATGLEPPEVADKVLAAVQADEFLVLTHDIGHRVTRHTDDLLTGSLPRMADFT